MTEAEAAEVADSWRYVFVDLDYTFARTDLFVEGMLLLLKQNPLNLFRIIGWLLQGRPVAKEQVALRAALDFAHLPLEKELLAHLAEEKRQGKRIVLATSCHRAYAERLAAEVGLFDDVLATEVGCNLKGETKLAAIREQTGGAPFAYAGDGEVDRCIWQASAAAILVNPGAKDIEAAEGGGRPATIFRSRPPLWRALLKEMRPHQYAKNVLLFVPLLTSHAYFQPAAVAQVVLAFLAFCLCASGVYFLNDLLDLASDRRHETKRKRPLASGDLPVWAGVAGAAALPVLAFLLSLLILPGAFVLVLAAYFVLTNAYSFFLKRVSTADVLTLSLLYTLRVVAGAAAIGVFVSFWLMAFSIFLFVSLAYLKRYVEVAALNEQSLTAPGRGYSHSDAETMFMLGVANITAAVLVLALYLNSDEVVRLYATPELLWFLCLLMLYWGNRVWVGARRGKIAEDPVVFAIKDKVSRMVGVAVVGVVLAARYIVV